MDNVDISTSRASTVSF